MAGAEPWSSTELARARSLALSALPPPPPSVSNRFADDPAAAALGKKLFFDKRLSINGSVSCATCHIPEIGFQDGRSVGVGITATSRRTMPLAGVAFSPFLFWDGRADSLWSQALGPLEDPREHGGDRTFYAHLVSRHYEDSYEAIFGPLPDMSGYPARAGPVPGQEPQKGWSSLSRAQREAVTRVFVNVGKALAAFQRAILPEPSRFDEWVASPGFPVPGRLSANEVAGLRLFVGRAACIDCHNGPLFSNRTFHNTGVSSSDVGRSKGARLVTISEFNCYGKYSDASGKECTNLRFMRPPGPDQIGAFKTPSLRGVASRAPFMHAGQISTLEEVIAHYLAAAPGDVGTNEIHPVELSEQEAAQLVAFLRTLDPYRN